MQILIHSMGVDTPHGVDEVIERQEGIPHYLLASFSTPFVGLNNGKRYLGKPGDCLLQRPGTPDYFASLKAAKEGFRGDWLHLNGSIIEEWIAAYDVPVNRYVSTGHPHLFTELARAVLAERLNQNPFWQRASAQLVERMFLVLARADRVQGKMASLSPSECYHHPKFVMLRETLRSHAARNWTTAAIAAEVGLSPSRTCALYRKFFGVPPGEDVLLGRLEMAKARLVSGRDSVAEIAEACGFSSIYHFSRMFKRRVGCAPTQYAKLSRF